MLSQTTKSITLYGAPWCGDCLRAKAYLDSLGCPYTFINIEEDEHAVAKVIEFNKGYRSIPTIEFPDGTILVEPSNESLKQEIESLKNSKICICHKQEMEKH